MNWMLKFHFKNRTETKVCNPSDNPYVFAKMYRGNPYIKEVSLHQETLYIEEEVFKDCTSLEKVNISPKVKFLTSKMFTV